MTILRCLIGLTLMASVSANAQETNDFTRSDGLRTSTEAIYAATDADRVAVFLNEQRLSAPPSAGWTGAYNAYYRYRLSQNEAYPRFERARSSYREEEIFEPPARFANDCQTLVTNELARVLTPSVRSALQIEVQPYTDLVGKHVVSFQKVNSWGKEVEYFVESAAPNSGPEIYSRELESGQPFRKFFDTLNPETDEEQEFMRVIRFRARQGECYFYNQNVTVRIYLRYVATATPAANVAKAPVRQAPASTPPKGRSPALTVTSPSPAKAAAPVAIVYKPGERPKPPAGTKLPPCPPGPGVCVVADGGPATPQALAAMEKARAYAIAVQEFEAKEAAGRAAVADLNKQRQAEYAAQLAATEKQRADALAARDAQIAANQAAYQAKLRAHQQETARLSREHEAAMAEWRRKTAACLAGDRTQCGPE